MDVLLDWFGRDYVVAKNFEHSYAQQSVECSNLSEYALSDWKNLFDYGQHTRLWHLCPPVKGS